MSEQKTSDGLDSAVDKGVDGAMAVNNAVNAAKGIGEAAAAVGESAATTAAGTGASAGGATGASAAAGTAVGGPAGTAAGAAIGFVASVLAKPVAKCMILSVVFFALIFKSLPSMLFENPIDMADNTGPLEVYEQFKDYAMDAYDNELAGRRQDIERAFQRRIADGEFDDYDDVVFTYEFKPDESVFQETLEDSSILIIAMFEMNTDEWRKATFKDFKRVVNSVNFWHDTITVSKEDEEQWTERDSGDEIRHVHITYKINDEGIDRFRNKFGVADDAEYIKAVEMAYNTHLYFGEVEDMPMGGVSGGGAPGCS